MEAINRAYEGVDAFNKMMGKTMGVRVATSEPTQSAITAREVSEWNAAVERKRAEKQARKLAAKVKP